MPDAAVVGSGPNGLAAAIVLAQAGLTVRVLEAADTVGGGARSAELTLPGFVHDVCSAVHPLGAASPLFRRLDLAVEWVHPPAPAAHPFDGGTAAVLERGLEETAAGLGADRGAYRRLVGPFVEGWRELEGVLLGPHPVSAKRLLALARKLGAAAAGRRRGGRAPAGGRRRARRRPAPRGAPPRARPPRAGSGQPRRGARGAAPGAGGRVRPGGPGPAGRLAGGERGLGGGPGARP